MAFALQLTEIYPRADLIDPANRPALGADLDRRLASIVFFDKVLFTHETIKPQYWDGEIDATNEERTYDIPGILGEASFDGVAVFYNHVMLWKGTRLIWSDVADFSLWFPLSRTITSLTLTTTNSFTQVSAGGVVTENIFTDVAPLGLVKGTPMRNVDLPNSTYWLVDYVSPFSGQSYKQENFDAGSPVQTIGILPADNKRRLYIAQGEILPALEDSVVHPLSDTGGTDHLKIVDQSPNVSYLLFASYADAALPAPQNAQLDLTLVTWPANTLQSVKLPSAALKQMSVGDIVSIDITVSTGRELFEVEFIDYGNGQVDLRRGAPDPVTGVNEISGRAPWDQSIGSGTDSIVITLQRWIEVENVSGIPVTVPKGDSLVEQYYIKLQAVGSTGEAEVGEVFPTGTELLTVDANESGEIQNVDPQVAGEIYNFVQIGEMGYILKERSIQSVQYVGLSQGVFYIRAEITEDGLLGRNAFTKLNDDSIAMLGNRDLYIYKGGRDQVPVAREYTIQLFKELDYDARHEVSMHHDELSREIWIVYPTIIDGVRKKKVFIYNYEDRSCTLDDYSSNEVALTAMAYAKPFQLVTWNDLVGDWTQQTVSWRDLNSLGIDKRLLIGAFQADNSGGKIPNGCELLERETDLYFLATNTLTRFGTTYTAEFEIADIDFRESRRFKYLDEIYFTFDFEEFVPKERPLVMQVSAGARSQSDGSFIWTPYQRLEVSGDGSVVTKCNLRAGGRYLRLRIKSDEPSVFWQIAQIELFARMGGYY
jgi:hypothetical protein